MMIREQAGQCPFCGHEMIHEVSENTGLFVCQNFKCGAKIKFPGDLYQAMKHKSESERRFNMRYKPTCTMKYSGDPQSEENPNRVCTKCGAYNIYNEYYDGNGHRAIMKFCPECGSEIAYD